MDRMRSLKTSDPDILANAPSGQAKEASEPDKSNILLIMTDQQSSDLMSCVMGTQVLHTPHMDSLAEHGLRFTRAYTPNPLCVPARNSIFSGCHPHTTGIQSNSSKKLDIEKCPLMGSMFLAAGYDTGYFGKWHINAQKDVDQSGFQEMAVNQGNGHDDEIATPTIEFLTRKRDKPFLAVASFSNPHDVCQLARGEKLPGGEVGEPPPPEFCPPAPSNLAEPKNETDTMSLARRSYQASPMFPVGMFTSDDWRQLRWGYYRLIEKVDAEIGKILTAMRASGLDKTTLIIFTSDHGDCAGAHRFNQKTVFYEESVRVPLIMSFGEHNEVSVSDLLVNIGLDILPTMLDFAGIRTPSGLKGRSLKALVSGEKAKDWRKYLVVENHITQGEPVDGMEIRIQGRMVRSCDFKYCVYDRGQNREALFDMKNDLGETINLAGNPKYNRTLREHRQMLRDHAKNESDRLVDVLLAGDVGPISFPEENE